MMFFLLMYITLAATSCQKVSSEELPRSLEREEIRFKRALIFEEYCENAFNEVKLNLLLDCMSENMDECGNNILKCGLDNLGTEMIHKTICNEVDDDVQPELEEKENKAEDCALGATFSNGTSCGSRTTMFRPEEEKTITVCLYW